MVAVTVLEGNDSPKIRGGGVRVVMRWETGLIRGSASNSTRKKIESEGAIMYKHMLIPNIRYNFGPISKAFKKGKPSVFLSNFLSID